MPLALPVFWIVNVSLTVCPGATVLPEPAEMVSAGAFCTTTLTVFEVVPYVCALASSYVALEVFEITVFAAVPAHAARAPLTSAQPTTNAAPKRAGNRRLRVILFEPRGTSAAHRCA